MDIVEKKISIRCCEDCGTPAGPGGIQMCECGVERVPVAQVCDTCGVMYLGLLDAPRLCVDCYAKSPCENICEECIEDGRQWVCAGCEGVSGKNSSIQCQCCLRQYCYRCVREDKMMGFLCHNCYEVQNERIEQG